VTVRELLDNKVRAEFRKSRALDIEASSLPAIFGRSFNVHAPLDEQFACQKILSLFTMGYVALMVDGKMVTDLDTVVELNRRTGLQLVVPQAKESIHSLFTSSGKAELVHRGSRQISPEPHGKGCAQSRH
jgi:hypothetical protein